MFVFGLFFFSPVKVGKKIRKITIGGADRRRRRRTHTIRFVLRYERHIHYKIIGLRFRRRHC